MKIDFSKPLETVLGEPVKYICSDVVEYKSARICVDDEGIVYSSPYIGIQIRNVKEEWAGEGLPPVGTVCEWHGPNSDGPNGWVYAESQVVAYTEDGLFVCMQAPSCWPVVQRIDNCEFRPIRTPEQIAAEEQESAVLEMLKDAGKQDGPNARLQAMTLYKAGWRKQVMP